MRKKPYKLLLAPGIYLCYRRNEGTGTWSAKAGWLKRFALADDVEKASIRSVMSFSEAQQHALKMARGSDGDSDKPVTVADPAGRPRGDLISNCEFHANWLELARRVPLYEIVVEQPLT